jgi:hypothetical protein
MNRLFRLLICLALATTPTSAGWFPLTEPSTTNTHTACSVVSGTTITFTAAGLGTANPNRITAVSINWDDSTAAGTAEITAVTVGGNSATRAVRTTGGVANSNSEIWWLNNPTGTSGNVVITSSTNIDGVTIAVYSLIGFSSIAPTAIATGTTSASQAYSNKNVGLAAASRTTNVSTSLSNMVNDFSSACGSSLWGVHASQSLRGNNQTLTTTISPTSNNPKIALAIWSTNAPAGSCTQSVAWFARAPSFDTTHFTAYDNLICGLVTDGVWTKFDVLQIYATQNTTAALLNMVSSSYAATLAAGASSFTADRGFTGVSGQTCSYLDTHFNPTTASSPNYTQNSAHFSAWSVVDAGAINLALIGIQPISGNESEIYPKWVDNNAYFRINGAGSSGVANATPTGFYLANRSASNAIQGYKNSTSIVTDTTASGTPNNADFTVGADGACGSSGNAQQVAQISIGSSLSSTDELNFYNRLRTYMTAVGVP